MKLYELTDAYKKVLSDEELDPQTVYDTLDAIKDDIKVKADGIASLISELKNDADRKKKKADAWRESAKVDEAKANWLQRYLTEELDNAGIKKLETDNHLLSTRNYIPSVIIDDSKKLPVDYMEEKIDYQPVKKRIREALKAGKEVPGAHLKENRKTVIK